MNRWYLRDFQGKLFLDLVVVSVGGLKKTLREKDVDKYFYHGTRILESTKMD